MFSFRTCNPFILTAVTERLTDCKELPGIIMSSLKLPYRFF